MIAIVLGELLILQAAWKWILADRHLPAILLFLLCSAFAFFYLAARRGRRFYVRPIPGLDAIAEAVGRATEMGRPCLFIPGIQDLNDIQTVAGLTVLSKVAELTAEYGATLDVPTTRSMVMTAARETVRAAYVKVGRAEDYQEDDIRYLTDEQFAFVAGVTGKMLREPPAACFYMGAFYAESLFLAETGNAIGAFSFPAVNGAGSGDPEAKPSQKGP